MSWGAHALVLEPESLRDEILAEAERVIERYSATKTGVRSQEPEDEGPAGWRRKFKRISRDADPFKFLVLQVIA